MSDAIDSGRITPDNKLVDSSPTITSSLDLRYAYAASDMVGIQTMLAGAYGESINRRTGSDWAWRFGLAVHLDLLESTDVPIGFIGAYQIATLPDRGEDIDDRTQAFMLNISYTGRRELGLGVDLEYQRIPLRGMEEPVGFMTAGINMQYFF